MSYPGPPYPPPSGRYSPSRPYSDRAAYPSAPPPPREFPPYPPTYSTPVPAPYRSYDNYPSEPPRPFPYEQPRPYDAEHYDPYQPSSTGYDPHVRPSSTYTAPHREVSRQAPPVPRSPPRRQAPRPENRVVEASELTLLTPPATVNVSGYTTAVFSLPASHLPITKYVSLNKDDALDLHRHLCSVKSLVWYADGSSRAGEGWSAAVEWLLESGRSGSKMRGCVGDGDALDAELGGICKAVEGFQETLQQSIKSGTPLTAHELIIFCDSQAAIVSIDTSSRPGSVKFCKLWKDICSEYLKAHMILVWIPKQSQIEGNVLADKIAVVGATNSYLKKKKSGVLPDIYLRPGGGESAPGASTEPGPWQRGDADPSRRKTPFERPKPLPISPVLLHPPGDNGLKLDLAPENIVRVQPQTRSEQEDESLQAKDGSLFVTWWVHNLLSELTRSFPEQASAKDLGILFAQYGDIIAVDIFSVSPIHPRFALITYTDTIAGDAAISALHRQPINLETAFAKDNAADLKVWQRWDGVLTVIRSEPGRLVPSSVMSDFPPLPDWAVGVKSNGESSADVKRETEGDSASALKKREREHDTPNTSMNSPRNSPPSSVIDSPSPHKRPRGAFAPDAAVNGYQAPAAVVDSATVPPALVPGIAPNVSSILSRGFSPKPVIPSAFQSDEKRSEQNTTPPPNPSQTASASLTASDGQTTTLLSRISTLPPTPVTAQRASERARSPPRQREQSREPRDRNRSSESTPSSSKPTLTNSAAVPQELPIRVGAKTLKTHISLVRNVLVKHDVDNWIAHACLIATDLDTARRALQSDLYATDEAFLAGRDFEQTLAARGFMPSRVDGFIKKVLGVLDGIAMADEADAAAAASTGSLDRGESVPELELELGRLLERYPDQTKEAIASAGKVMEYLMRGKEAQEKRRIEVERRVKVLEGMVKIGEVVSGVVRFLLTDTK